MKTKLFITGILASIFFVGCVEDMDIKILENDLGKLIIEGEISDEEPPYIFRVSKTIKLNSKYNPGVGNALLILEDNEGVKDTLQHVDGLMKNYMGLGYYCRFIYENRYNGKNDTVYLSNGLTLDAPLDFADGFYVTNKIKGKANNTYTLTVKHDNREYVATEKMPTETTIDSLWVDWKANDKEGAQITPFVNFRNDPAIDNYYLFSFERVGLAAMVEQDKRVWRFSIVEDKHMPELVNEFNPNDGEAVRGYSDGMWYSIGDSATVRLGSITKACYDYYFELIQQLRYDGGAFTPAPTTGRSNFSNGALGFFRAVSVSEKKIKNDK